MFNCHRADSSFGRLPCKSDASGSMRRKPLKRCISYKNMIYIYYIYKMLYIYVLSTKNCSYIPSDPNFPQNHWYSPTSNTLLTCPQWSFRGLAWSSVSFRWILGCPAELQRSKNNPGKTLLSPCFLFVHLWTKMDWAIWRKEYDRRGIRQSFWDTTIRELDAQRCKILTLLVMQRKIRWFQRTFCASCARKQVTPARALGTDSRDFELDSTTWNSSSCGAICPICGISWKFLYIYLPHFKPGLRNKCGANIPYISYIEHMMLINLTTTITHYSFIMQFSPWSERITDFSRPALPPVSTFEKRRLCGGCLWLSKIPDCWTWSRQQGEVKHT